MSRITFHISPTVDLSKHISSSVKKYAFKHLKKAEKPIENRVRDLLFTVLSNDDTLDAMLSGTLKKDFGFTDSFAIAAVSNIIHFISNSLSVEVVEYRNLKYSAIRLTLNPNIDDLLSLPVATYMSGDHPVSWLDWLLTRGSEIAVEGYEVEYQIDRSSKSRSGYAFMRKLGGSFRVDPAYSGTRSDNFITRILDKMDKPMTNIFTEEIRRAFA